MSEKEKNAKMNGRSPAIGYDGPDHGAGGLTKREYIAAHAMAGLMASYDPERGINEISDPQLAARISILHADALLEALEE